MAPKSVVLKPMTLISNYQKVNSSADLVNGIVGMSIGETRDVNVTFPADYAREDLACSSGDL